METRQFRVPGTCNALASRKGNITLWRMAPGGNNSNATGRHISPASKQAGSFLDYTARSNMTCTWPLASPLQFLSTCL